MRSRASVVASVVLATTLAAGARASDDFYQARLQEGRIAYQTGSAAEAADLLRISCFGLMDQPPLYSEGLAWLALAQTRLGRTADADATLRRFLEVEKRFAVYPRTALPAATRAEFEELLARRMSPEALSSVPTLVRLVETEDQKLGKLQPKERRRALEAKAAARPAEAKWPLALARLAAEMDEPKETARWATKALELDPQDVEARRLRAGALMARRSFAEALADLDALPPALLASTPALRADRLVCLVAGKSWEGARETAKGLPEEVLARPDVVAALKKVPAPAEAPATAAPAVPAAQATVASAPTPAPTPTPAPAAKTVAAAQGAPAKAAPPAATAAHAAPGVTADEELKARIREALAAGTPEKAKAYALALVAARPHDREARKLLLEAACMSRDWKGVAAQAKLLAPFVDGEEPSMLYAAVGLYETGNVEEARPLMKRARPLIASTPFVNFYAERLLGDGAPR